MNPFTETDELAAQILNSASSLRHSRSDEKVSDVPAGNADHRFSLTDSHLIEQQTRISFKALFGETIPPDSDNHPLVEKKKSNYDYELINEDLIEDSRTQATPTKDTEIELRLTQDTYCTKSESDQLEHGGATRLAPNNEASHHHSALSMISSSALSDDVFRADSSTTQSAPLRSDPNGNYFKFPSVGANNTDEKTVSD